MKPMFHIVLAVACLTLAGVLIWHGTVHSKTARSEATSGGFLPATPIDDVDLLDRPVGEIRFDAAPLGDVLKTLAERCKVNIWVDWPRLSRMESDRKTPVSLSISNATLGDVLRAISDDVTGPYGPAIGIYVSDGIVTVTTPQEAATHTLEVFLNIRPLVDELYGDILSQIPKDTPAASLPTREEILEQLTKLITDEVAVDSWKDSGGSTGTLREMDGILVISQSAGNIRDIRIMLGRLHQALHENAISSIPVTATNPAIIRATTRPARVTAYFNIRPLLEKVQAVLRLKIQSGTEADASLIEAGSEIAAFVINTVDSDSWNDNGGTEGVLHEVAGVLVVTQTPANIEAVRVALQNLQSAIDRSDFHPTTTPVPATTQATDPQ